MTNPSPAGSPDLTGVLLGSALLVHSTAVDGRVQFANAAWKTALEYSDDDIARGLSLMDVVAPEERGHATEVIERLMSGATHAHVRSTLVTRTGVRVNVVGEVNAQRDAAGTIISMGGIFRDVSDEMRERLEIERLKLRTDTMLSAITEGVVIVNAAGMVEAVNDAGERILGASRKMMVGARLLDLPWVAFDEDGVIIDRARHPLLAALQSGEAQSEKVLRYPRPDGTEVWIATAARPLRRADGRVEGALSSFRDVTAERVAREAVRASEIRYRKLFEHNGTIQLLTDAQTGIIEAANPAALRFYGYEASEVIGQHGSMLSRTDAASAASLTTSITSGKVSVLRRTHYQSSGEAREVEAYASPVQADGRTLLHTIIIDITSRLDAERSRHRLASILDQTPDIVGMFGLDGQLFYTNQAGRALMGLPPMPEGNAGAPMLDIPRNTIHDAHPGGDADLVLREATAIATERGVWSGETMLRLPNGDMRIMNQVILAHRHPDGSVSHFSSVMHDITELRRVEMQLIDQSHELEVQTEELRQQGDELAAARDAAESANAAKSQFLAHMSHELRTPLGAIIGFSRVLASNRGGNLTAREITFAERVSDNAVRLLALINQLLDLSKVEAGKSDLDVADVDVSALVVDVVADLQAVARAPGVELVVDAPRSVVIQADATKLRQVVVNLMSNAIKFTAEGQVVVRVGEEFLSVSDSGVGISPQNLAAIFEPFAQEDSSITRRFGGTGLGLAISRRFCEAMGFALTVESVAGEGSTFTVSFRSPA